MSFEKKIQNGINEDLNLNFTNENLNLEFINSNTAEISLELSDIIEDNNDSFGISLYEDLIDISSININNTSNNSKIIEDEVTLKMKVERNLGLYKIIKERKFENITKLEEIMDVNIGLSNDIIGCGNLKLELVKDKVEYYTLTWSGKLLDFLINVDEKIENNFLYSFPIEYIIDINLKYIQNESFIFIKSDFQLKNETIFLQLSFNNNENANNWFKIIKKYKNYQNKNYFSKNNTLINDESQFKIDKEETSNIKNVEFLVSNKNTPKISIPFYRKSKNLKRYSNSNNLKEKINESYTLISFEDKNIIEKTIKNLIFNENDQFCNDIELKKRLIEQKCSYINFVVNSIESNLFPEYICKKYCEDSNLLSSSSYSDNNCIKVDQNKFDNFTCPICFETVKSDKIITLNPCGHKICYHCELKLVDSICPWDRSRYHLNS